MAASMKIITNVFGPEISLKKEVVLQPESSALREVLRALRDNDGGAWMRILKEDLSLEKGCVILLNGRNISNLEQLDTQIHDGDEITLTVMIAGG